MRRKIVIVGGVAGGASAAARLRRWKEEDEIVLIERGEHVSFANCGLPYYIGGAIDSRDKLFVQTAQGITDRFQVNVRVLTEVLAIDREQRQVTLRKVATGEVQQENYDVLILSPGAKPIVPSIEGIHEATNLFTLRNVKDTDRIHHYIEETAPVHATVIGAGFIGLEMAENLRERGLNVTIIDRGKQILSTLDIEMVQPLEQHLRLHGVEVLLEEGVESLAQQGRILHLSSGRSLATDLVILAIGVTPENDLAVQSGLATGFRGAIQVNEQLQTSDPFIYAIGDVIEVKDKNHGFATMVSLAWGANRQGRLVADHLNGKSVAYSGALGTAIIKIFDLTAATTGNNEKTLTRLGIPYKAIHLHPNSHAGYYPGGSPISLKLLFDPESGQIYGAQAVGTDGVDKRIDVISTAIRGHLKADELADIELAYAPPYSSAKDPVNMLGYVAGNIIDGMVKSLQWHEVDSFIAQGGVMIDVRDEAECLVGSIPGSISIPLTQLRDRIADIPVECKLAVYCQVGLRGYIAARILLQSGYLNVKNVDGGYKTYAGTHFKTSDNDRSTVMLEDQPKFTASIDINLLTNDNMFQLDVSGLPCPQPMVQMNKRIRTLEKGQRLQIIATDLGFATDLEQWCERTGNTLESAETYQGVLQVLICKG